MTPIKMSWKEAISIAEIGDVVVYHNPPDPTRATYYTVTHKFDSQANLLSLQSNRMVFGYFTETKGKDWSVVSCKTQEKENFL